MSIVCDCSSLGGNTGTPTCYGVFDVTVKVVLVNYYKADGSINGIDISTLSAGGTVLSQTDWDALTNNVSSQDRFYPSPSLKNVVDERAEDIVEEFEDTTSVYIQDGARTFTGMIVAGDPIMLGNLQQWRCVTAGAFFIDKSGNLIGNCTREGFLDPVLIQNESFSAGFMKGTDTTKQKIQMNFIVDTLMNDSDLGMIEAVNITADLKGSRGLVDVVAGVPSGISTTEFTVQLNTKYGGKLNPIAAEGLVLADFAMAELSPTPAPIVISSVTESAITAGLYTFTFPAEASADVLQVSNTAVSPLTKNYDLEPFTVTIP